MKKVLILLFITLAAAAQAQLPTYLYGTDIRLQQRDTANNALIQLFISGRTTNKYLQNSGRGRLVFGAIDGADVPWSSGFPTYDGRYPSISRLTDSTAALRTAIASNQAVFSSNVVVNGPTGT